MKQTMAAGEFKAKCLQILDDVQQTRKPVVVTKRGKPVAQIVPVENETKLSIFGRLKGTGVVLGDIVGPIGESWDADK